MIGILVIHEHRVIIIAKVGIDIPEGFVVRIDRSCSCGRRMGVILIIRILN